MVLNNLQRTYETHVEEELRAAADHHQLTQNQLEASDAAGRSAAPGPGPAGSGPHPHP
jgi:hypothetical protein